jgi:hypothetical protein
MEPKDSAHRCRLIHNLSCSWFREAVLPGNAEILSEWIKIFEPEQVMPGTWVKSARCECGTLFRSKSNRKTLCDECSKKQRRIKQRGYRNKNREAGADKRALSAKISQ